MNRVPSVSEELRVDNIGVVVLSRDGRLSVDFERKVRSSAEDCFRSSVVGDSGRETRCGTVGT